MEEQWKDIFGYEGLYQVSNLGRVRSLPRNGTVNDIKILKPKKENNGYLRIGLCKNGEQKLYSIHRLVASAFIPNDDLFKTDINHKDENKENNNVENLEWCDAYYNNNYGNRITKANIKNRQNGCFDKFGKWVINNLSKSVLQYDLNGNFIQTWKSLMDIHRTLGFSYSHISQCCNGKRKTANGFIWKYKNDDE